MSDVASPIELPATPAPQHWPGTETANVVETGCLREITAGMASLRTDGGAMTVSGAPGLGKTFATDVAFHKLKIDKYWIAMPHQPKGKETTARIRQALTGERTPARVAEYDLLEDIVEILAGQHVALVIDEAQHLTAASFRQFRYLLDRRETRLLLVLCGVRVNQELSVRCPELHNRVERRVDFPNYRSAEMVNIARKYHPAYANSDAPALSVLSKAAGGNFRSWAKLLRAALTLDVQPDEGITVEQAHAAVRVVDGRTSDSTTRRKEAA